MLFRVELIAFSFLDLISKQARLTATLAAFLLIFFHLALSLKHHLKAKRIIYYR